MGQGLFDVDTPDVDERSGAVTDVGDDAPDAPLAVRMRPRTHDEVVGQGHPGPPPPPPRRQPGDLVSTSAPYRTHAGGSSRRRGAAATLLVAAVLLTGCSGSSAGGGTSSAAASTTGSASTSAPVSTSASVTGSASATGAPSGSVTGSGTTSGSGPMGSMNTPSTSVTSPTVAQGNAGAYTVIEPDGVGTTQVPSLTCGPGGAVVAPNVTVSAGGTSLTLIEFTGDTDVTVEGSANVDAAGGTFTGSNGSLRVVFTWTC